MGSNLEWVLGDCNCCVIVPWVLCGHRVGWCGVYCFIVINNDGKWCWCCYLYLDFSFWILGVSDVSVVMLSVLALCRINNDFREL